MVFLWFMESSYSCSFHIFTVFESKSCVTTKKMAAINFMPLNKTDTHIFPEKFLFTFRMVKVFVNIWQNLVVLLPDISWSQYKGRHELKKSQKDNHFYKAWNEFPVPNFLISKQYGKNHIQFKLVSFRKFQFASDGPKKTF